MNVVATVAATIAATARINLSRPAHEVSANHQCVRLGCGPKFPRVLGLRQPSAAIPSHVWRRESGRGLPQSKTQARNSLATNRHCLRIVAAGLHPFCGHVHRKLLSQPRCKRLADFRHEQPVHLGQRESKPPRHLGFLQAKQLFPSPARNDSHTRR